ncbi:MAG: ComEA family DNA-binding protein [Oscillospiraceae bacterium]|nr:ComEA family DNA-binding protein [Oscillospiraceae bacterium]
MKWEKLLVAVCAGALLVFSGFSLGVRWRASRWDTPYRVGTQRMDSGELPRGTEPPLESTPEPVPGLEPLPPEPAPADTPGLVNINTADLDALMALPGVGETRAQAILDDRAANGPFRYPEDITRVPGIGETLMLGMLDRITTESEDVE